MTTKVCKNDQILDLITQRCIKTDSPTFKKRLKEQVENNVQRFNIDDLKKLGFDIVMTQKIPEKVKDKMKDKIKELNIKDEHKVKLNEKLKKARENIRMNNFYIDDVHKRICETSEKELLNEPIIKKRISFNCVYYRSPLQGPFRPDMLSYSKALKHKWIPQDISLDGVVSISSNYDRENGLIKDEDVYNTLDMNWFKQINEYVKNLADYELFTIKAYTFHGDVLMNNYERGLFHAKLFSDRLEQFLNSYKTSTYFPLFFPLLEIFMRFGDGKNIHELVLDEKKIAKELKYSEKIKTLYRILKKYNSKDTSFLDIWEREKKNNSEKTLYTNVVDVSNIIRYELIEEAVSILSKSFDKIVRNSPATTKKMILYRGDKESTYFNKDTGNMFFRIKGFISTSLSYNTAVGFTKHDMGSNNRCCINEITILPGSKLLFIMGVSTIPSELEFVLGLKTTYLMRAFRQDSYIDRSHGSICISISKKKKRAILKKNKLVVL